MMINQEHVLLHPHKYGGHDTSIKKCKQFNVEINGDVQGAVLKSPEGCCFKYARVSVMPALEHFGGKETGEWIMEIKATIVQEINQ